MFLECTVALTCLYWYLQWQSWMYLQTIATRQPNVQR